MLGTQTNHQPQPSQNLVSMTGNQTAAYHTLPGAVNIVRLAQQQQQQQQSPNQNQSQTN
jgi:hypothetical protein